MPESFVSEIVRKLGEFGFGPVLDWDAPDILLKRQTLNTNRAVLIHYLAGAPDDFAAHVRLLRKRVAFRCGFVPFFWGIGIQLIVVGPGLTESGVSPANHVAFVDNQWAIIQSVFLVDTSRGTYASGRTWGQLITGQFQDAIDEVLSNHFKTPLTFLRSQTGAPPN
jgi:hypothetical protein